LCSIFHLLTEKGPRASLRLQGSKKISIFFLVYIIMSLLNTIGTGIGDVFDSSCWKYINGENTNTCISGNAVIARGYLPVGVTVSRRGPQVGFQPSQTRTKAPQTAMAGNRGTR
jgi:hypothetical protein